MASWWAAVAMLTRLPAGPGGGGRSGARWFGLVGALVGFGGLVPMVTLGTAVPAAAGVLALGVMAILSGALHLDGLADTADALTAIGPGAAERARKDPSIGVAGATALILVLGVDVASLATLATAPGPLAAGLACLAGGAASRAVSVVVARAARGRATGTGLGMTFARTVSVADASIAALGAAAVVVVASLAGGGATVAAGSLLGSVAGVVLGLAIVRLRGQLDGDGLGAAVELSFAAILVSTAAVGRWPAA